MHKDIIKEIHTLNEKLLQKNIFKGGKGFYQLLDERPNVNKRNVFFCLSMEEGKKYILEFAPPNLNHVELQKYLRRALFLLILDPRRNVVSARDFSIDPNQGFVVLDWVAGVELHAILRKSSLITINEALWILTDLTKALEHLADFSFVHRNIHPRNIIIRKQSADAYLSGLEYLAQSDFMETKLVDINTNYISPELMRSLIFPDTNIYLTPSSDVYSIGAIFFHMLTGVPPFSTKRNLEKWSSKRYKVPKLEDVQTSRKQKKMLQFLIKKMMEFDPHKRWSTMEIRDYAYDCLDVSDRDKDMQRFL
ncbi:serine/threonine protein kinase [Candidatus Uabimicrobium sp. HlEnr_7]|uniref:serine/threonine protein kinase n=1 Tax=Candidatus Uabimicrobium helgolandensis TaxID=3095367 RepID=UPI003556473C